MLGIVVNFLRAPFQIIDEKLLGCIVRLHRLETDVILNVWRHRFAHDNASGCTRIHAVGFSAASICHDVFRSFQEAIVTHLLVHLGIVVVVVGIDLPSKHIACAVTAQLHIDRNALSHELILAWSPIDLTDASRSAICGHAHTYLVNAIFGYGRASDGDVVNAFRQYLVALIVGPVLVSTAQEHESGLLAVDGHIVEVLLIGVAREVPAGIRPARESHFVVHGLGLQFPSIVTKSRFGELVANVLAISDGLVDGIDNGIDKLHDA